MNFWPLLPFMGLLLRVQSQECDLPFGDIHFNVTDQHYIDALSSSCTTMLGTLLIANNFTGQFHLPNITNITGRILSDWQGQKPTPSVTSIDLPDLQYLGNGIDVESLSDTLERISIPKLEYLRSLALKQYIDYAEVDFRGLKKADFLHVSGHYSKVSFDSLQNVNGSLSICNQEQSKYALSIGSGPRRAMNVSLPNLEEVADRMEIRGDISELITSKLIYADLTVLSRNTSVQFNFPHLTHAGSTLDLEGNITGLSIPRLQEGASNLRISSSYPLNVTLPFTTGHHIILDRQIKDVVFPNLQTYERLGIYSYYPLDCNTVVNRINETTIDSQSALNLKCISTYKKPSGLATKAKIAIGVVVGVVGLGIIVVGVLFWKKKQATKKQVVMKNTESEVELTGFANGLWGETPIQGPAEAQVAPPAYKSDRD